MEAIPDKQVVILQKGWNIWRVISEYLNEVLMTSDSKPFEGDLFKAAVLKDVQNVPPYMRDWIFFLGIRFAKLHPEVVSILEGKAAEEMIARKTKEHAENQKKMFRQFFSRFMPKGEGEPPYG